MKKLILAVLVLIATYTCAVGRDGYGENGRPVVCNEKDFPDATGLALCKRWITNAKRPDEPDKSCCGDGDAYIADAFVEHDGKYFAIITEDYAAIQYSDDEGNTVVSTPGIKKGAEVEIPKDKLNNAAQNGGNPSGHGIIFIGGAGVLCYFGPTLS